jgi:prepilin-type N-terminal cleavage/methylation domain-containing protein
MLKSLRERGFTLIELVIVIVVLGILASIALPKYEDLAASARASAIKGSLGSIRASVHIQLAKAALTTGTAGFPPLTSAIFADGQMPAEPVTPSQAVKTTPGVDNTGGWVYLQATGQVKCNLNAYSSY